MVFGICRIPAGEACAIAVFSHIFVIVHIKIPVCRIVTVIGNTGIGAISISALVHDPPGKSRPQMF